MNKHLIKAIYIFTILIVVGAWWYGAQYIKEQQPLSSGLPYFGSDTTHATDYLVKDFSFYNQDSVLIGRKNFENKIWVSEFFFSTCEGICPIMNQNLAIVQDSFQNDSNVFFLSHTVDPETDDIHTLRTYAEKNNYKKSNWHFVTGDKATIYDLARTSYFSATPKDSTLGEDFVHSQLLCLIDPHLHIRGYYDGTNGKDIKKLIQDIKLLKIEFEMVKKERNWILRLFE